jgi:hypothetical protein
MVIILLVQIVQALLMVLLGLMHVEPVEIPLHQYFGTKILMEIY